MLPTDGKKQPRIFGLTLSNNTSGDVMIFIYNCYAGTHSSSIAAAIHLGQIEGDRVPDSKRIQGINLFNRLDVKDMGRIIYRGTDEEGNRVYTLGRGSSRVVIPAMAELAGMMCEQHGLSEKIIFANMTHMVTPFMSVGGFISRRLKLDFLGLPFLILGSKQAYLKIGSVVKMTREQAKSAEGPVIILENKQL